MRKLADEHEAEEQPINGLAEMRQRVARVGKPENERRHAEERINKAAEEWRTTLDSIADLVSIQDKDFKLVRVNKAFADALETEPEELIGRTCYQTIHGINEPYPNCPHKQTLETKRSVMVELFEPRLGVYLQVSTSPILNDEGEVVGTVHIAKDITERRRAEEALRDSEEMSRGMLESAAAGIYIVQDRKFQYVSPLFEEISGYTSDELIGTYSLDYVHPEDKEAVRKGVIENLKRQSSSPHEFRLLRKDGKHVWILEKVASIRYRGQRAVVGSLMDITVRKRAEEALRESEEGYRALLNLGAEAGEAVIMLQDTEQGEGVQTFVNDEWLRVTGYLREELLAMSFFDIVHPKHRDASIERHHRKMQGEAIPGLFEISIIRKDGTEVPVELTSACTTYKGKRANITYIRDISERRKMEEQLIITDRLASVGELASGIAHELNNPLTSVIGFSQLLLERDVADDVKKDAEVICSEAQRAAEVVKNLLTFARKHTLVKQPINMNSIIERVLELRAYEQRVNNIQVNTQFAPDLPETLADYFKLQQVFLNIIINAEHFMIESHNRGTLDIITGMVNDIIKVLFIDDGPGIPEENLWHLFDPFFTTKEVGSGTGLGLSICHGIVTEHGGRIYAESELGKGATFVVELPISND
ncbi:PAS domain S-box protein [Chloroflexota bacterium]